MDTFLKIDLNIMAAILCTGMYIMNLKLSDKNMMRNRLFRLLIVVTIGLLLLESICWAIDGKSGALARIINFSANTLGFIVAPFPAAVWTLYASFQLFHDINRLKTEMRILAVPIVINAAFAVSSPFTGWLYSIDGDNLYHRGPVIAVFAVIALLPVVYTAVCYIANRKKMSRSMFIPMLLFAVPPVTGAVFQTFFYGISIIWSSITVSIFIVHTGIQNKQFYMDHLTGVYNRRQLDSYLNGLLQAGRKQTDFACIMLDINHFKSINDTFGHVVGDDALKDAAALLKSCIRSSDFLARYAGDEFVMLLDSGDEATVQLVIQRIHDKAGQFNASQTKAYRLEFSVGYEIYRRGSCLSYEDLISRVDALMYQDKNRGRVTTPGSLDKVQPVYWPASDEGSCSNK